MHQDTFIVSASREFVSHCTSIRIRCRKCLILPQWARMTSLVQLYLVILTVKWKRSAVSRVLETFNHDPYGILTSASSFSEGAFMANFPTSECQWKSIFVVLLAEASIVHEGGFRPNHIGA